MPVVEHDPDGVYDFTFNWEPFLNTGDAIVQSVWEDITPVTVPTLDIEDSEIIGSGQQTVVWFSGGADKTLYKVVNKVTTQDGLQYNKTVNVYCKHQ